MARKLIVEIIGDASSLEKSLKRAEGRTSTFGSKLKTLGKTGALAAGAAGIGAVAATLKIGIDEFTETTKVAAQTNAVLKSTGKAANVTAKHVDDLSSSLLKKSGVDDEAIKTGENMLLTFTRIRNEAGKGNDIFDQTTKAVLDMDTAMTHGNSTAESLAHTSIMVGKALNDPLKGAKALRRVGVALTDQQTDQIAAFVKSGDTLKAQKIILAELNGEFGGSAEALGKTLPGQINIVRESFRNWAGELVAKMIPAITRFGNWVREHWPEVRKAILDAWVTIKPTLVAFGELVGAIVSAFQKNWPTIKPIVMGVVKVIKDAFAVLTPLLQLFADLLRGDWSKAWVHFKQVIVREIHLIKDEISLVVKGIFSLITGLGKAIARLLLIPINAVIDSINAIKIGGKRITIPGTNRGFTTPGVDPIPHIPHISLGGGGDIVIHNVVELDGQKVSANTTRHQARANRRTAAQRTGRVAGLGPVVG